MHQFVLGVPGANTNLSLHRKGRITCRPLVAVIEIVDKFLDANAPAGGSMPFCKYRRTLLYEASSTSMEKVESGFCFGARNSFSTMGL
jgi:hypothetical protein